MQPRSPIRGIQLNLGSIPDSIRTDAILKSGMTVGLRQRFRSISTRRTTEEVSSTLQSFKAKRVEDIETILNRVVRANCCLQNVNPEQFEVMQRAVGDGSEYMKHPNKKAFRIRLKFLNNNFLQNV